MLTLFRYNWQVRDEWFAWCESVPEEELLRERTGGVGSILKTLYHIVDVEQSWIYGLLGKPGFHDDFESYNTLERIRALSDTCRPDMEAFIRGWTPEMEWRTFEGVRHGRTYSYRYGEVLRHVIAHEMHHIGQLSVWAREMDRQPVSANLIGRGLVSNKNL